MKTKHKDITAAQLKKLHAWQRRELLDLFRNAMAYDKGGVRHAWRKGGPQALYRLALRAE